MDGALIGWLAAMGIFAILILYGALMEGEEDDQTDIHQQDSTLQGDLRPLRKMDAGQRGGTGRRAEHDEEKPLDGNG